MINYAKKRNSFPLPIVIFIVICGILPLFSISSFRLFGMSVANATFFFLFIVSFFSVRYSRLIIELYTPHFLPLISLAIVLAFQIIINPFDLKQLLNYIAIYTIYIVSNRCVIDPNQFTVNHFFNLLKLSSFVAFGMGLFQYLFDLQLYPSDMLEIVTASHENGGPHRAIGGMLSPNGYGCYAALISGLYYAKLLQAKTKYLNNRTYHSDIFMFILAFSQVIISQSRSAFFGLLLAIFMSVVPHKLSRKLLFRVMLVFPIILIFVFFYFTFIESLTDFISRSSVDPRWIFWLNAYEFVIANPSLLFTGLGIGDSNRSVIEFSDNLFIELLLNGGLPLLAAFSWLIMSPIANSKHTLFNDNYIRVFNSTVYIWRIIFIVTSFFSSSIAFFPYAHIFFFGLFFFGRLNVINLPKSANQK